MKCYPCNEVMEEESKENSTEYTCPRCKRKITESEVQ